MDCLTEIKLLPMCKHLSHLIKGIVFLALPSSLLFWHQLILQFLVQTQEDDQYLLCRIYCVSGNSTIVKVLGNFGLFHHQLFETNSGYRIWPSKDKSQLRILRRASKVLSLQGLQYKERSARFWVHRAQLHAHMTAWRMWRIWQQCDRAWHNSRDLLRFTAMWSSVIRGLMA